MTNRSNYTKVCLRTWKQCRWKPIWTLTSTTSSKLAYKALTLTHLYQKPRPASPNCMNLTTDSPISDGTSCSMDAFQLPGLTLLTRGVQSTWMAHFLLPCYPQNLAICLRLLEMPKPGPTPMESSPQQTGTDNPSPEPTPYGTTRPHSTSHDHQYNWRQHPQQIDCTDTPMDQNHHVTHPPSLSCHLTKGHPPYLAYLLLFPHYEYLSLAQLQTTIMVYYPN